MLRLGLLLALLWMSGARAEEPEAADPLLPGEVLAASRAHFPGILEALAQRQAAAGRLTEALGAFDLVFSAAGLDRALGFYEGTALEGKALKPLRPLGARAYAGYAISNGEFPIYQDDKFTNTGGTLKLGFLFSLLRNRAIDSRRFREIDARLDLQRADLEVLLTRIGVQQRALAAYWRWLATGRQLAVYEDLLAIALEREGALQREVASGRRAQIFLTENRQNIIRRQTLTTVARRDFQVAVNRLSFFLRGADGQPLKPAAQRLPAERQLQAMPPIPSVANLEVSELLARRPELRILRTGAERAVQKIAFSENQLEPRLDLNFELAEGLGAIGEGGASRDSADVIVGFTFHMPLERRQGKGRLAQARAELESLRQERRRVEDRVEIELRNILLELDIARQLMALSRQDVELSEAMRLAEIQRFEQGASDFFLVNIREETAADARVRYYAALQRTRVAQANFDAATVNLPRLGIQGAFQVINRAPSRR